MAPSGKKGHPVDGDGDCAVLIVKMVDMVCGAEARRHSSRSSLNGQRDEQGQAEGQSGAVRRAHAEAGTGPAAPLCEHRGACKQSTHAHQVRMGPEQANGPRFCMRQSHLMATVHLSGNPEPILP